MASVKWYAPPSSTATPLPPALSADSLRITTHLLWQITTAYIQSGAKVYISSRSLSSLQDTADKLNKLAKEQGTGGVCVPIVADLSKYVTVIGRKGWTGMGLRRLIVVLRWGVGMKIV